MSVTTNRTTERMKHRQLAIEAISITPGARRPIDEATVEGLARSMAELGQLQSVLVCSTSEGGYRLVAGAHRIAAAVKLGWREIQAAVVSDVSDIDARLIEIAENLHRAELTVQQRSDQIAEWIRLTEEKQRISVQVEPKFQRGRPEGIRAAAREIGVDRVAAIRARQIAAISAEGKQAAEKAGLSNNQVALLRIAKAGGATEQVAEVRKIHESKQSPKPSSGKLPRAERLEQIVSLTSQGYTAKQIAKEIGVSLNRVREIAKDEGVELTADKVTAKSHQLSAHRIIEETSHTLAGCAIAVATLEGPLELPKHDAAQWLSSLNESLKSLNALRRKLKEIVDG